MEPNAPVRAERSGRGELDAVEQYLREIRRIPVLDTAAEIALGERISTGDRSAVDELVRHNLRFVVMVARRYTHHGVPIEDLIDEGNIGLIRAAERFDERRGRRFISYAVFWIRRTILRYLDQKSRVVRMPVGKRRQMSRMAHAAERLPHLLGREPSVDEIAASIGLAPARVDWLRQLSTRPMRIDLLAAGEDSDFDADTLQDLHAPDFAARVEAGIDSRRLESCLQRLDRRSADIVRRYYGLHGGDPETLACIGEGYGVTRERARQLRDRAVGVLRVLCASGTPSLS